MIDGVAAENPGIRVTNVHPGVVEPLMGNKAFDAGAPYPIDEGEGRSFTVLSNTTGRKGLCQSPYTADVYILLVISLPADFLVCATRHGAAFL